MTNGGRVFWLALLGGGGVLLAGAVWLLVPGGRTPEIMPHPSAPRRPTAVSAPPAAPAPATAPVSALVCAVPRYDAGLQRVGTTVTHSFTVQNTGTRVCRIAAVKSSCGCTTATSRQRELSPGATTVIEARLSLNSPGQRTGTIMVYDQEPELPPLRLELTGEALADPVALTAAGEVSVNIGKVAFGVQFQRYLELPAVTGEQNWQVCNLSLPRFQVACERVGGRYLRLDFKPLYTPYGMGDYTGKTLDFSGQLMVQAYTATGRTDYPLRVSGVLMDSLLLQPSVLQMTPDAPLTAYVALRSRNGRPFRIAMIEAPAGVQIEVPDGEAERTFYVLQVHRLVPGEELQGKSVTIHTDDPQRAARLYFE